MWQITDAMGSLKGRAAEKEPLPVLWLRSYKRGREMGVWFFVLFNSFGLHP